MRVFLETMPKEAEVVVYADVQGEVDRPFPAIDSRAYVCGYFAVEAVYAQTDMAVILVGEALPL